MKHIFSNALTLCICTLFLLGCTHRSSSTYSWEKDLDYRLRYDFSWTEADVKKVYSAVYTSSHGRADNGLDREWIVGEHCDRW